MNIIWFNPDTGAYQRGTMADYDQLVAASSNSDRFDILYEFSDATEKIMDKILNSLNLARNLGISTN